MSNTLLLFEDHYSLKSVDKEVGIIASRKPAFVLTEHFNELYTSDKLQPLLDAYRNCTIDGICFKAARSKPAELGMRASEYPDIRKRVMKEIEENTLDYFGIIPESFEVLVNTNIYELHPGVVFHISNLTNNHSVKNAMLFYIQRTREHRIDLYQPRVADGRRLNAIANSGAKMVGIDLDRTDLMMALRQSRNKSPEEIRNQIDSWLQVNNPKRERLMGRKIAEYSRKCTDGSVIAIIGSKHGRPESEIYPTLKSECISYEAIFTED